jgi:hypothetical protein
MILAARVGQGWLWLRVMVVSCRVALERFLSIPK